MKNKGYTLAELLAVVVIFVIISSVITTILFSILRGSNKSKTLTSVSQNGNAAMSLMSSLVANSGGFVSITDYSGVTTSNCYANNPVYPSTPVPIVGKSILLKGQEVNAAIQLVCDETHNLIASNSGKLASGNIASPIVTSYLIDNSKLQIPVSSLGASACYFKCTQLDAFTPPQIEIFFHLQPYQGALPTSSFQENQNESDFKTTVILRNFKPSL